MDHGKVTVQPAGSAGKRRVFLTLLFDDDDDSARQVELVLSERGANQLAEALVSGTFGVMREFDLSAECPDG